MIGSQAYSLVVVRANSAKDAASVAQSMFDGINQNKWICVTANAVAAGAYGDTAMLVIANTDLGETLTTDLRAPLMPLPWAGHWTFRWIAWIRSKQDLQRRTNSVILSL